MSRFLIIAAAVAVPSAALADDVTRTAKVKGVPEVVVSTVSGDIVVKAGNKGEVSATFDTSNPKRIQFDTKGKQIRIRGARPSDSVQITVPSGTEVAVSTTSGDISVKGVGGDVRARLTSGELNVDDAAGIDVVSVSGEMRLTNVSGDVKLKVVSGDVFIQQNSRDDTKLILETVSGDVEWRGRCAKKCQLDLQGLSADFDLFIDKKSSFDLEFRSRSGDFKNRAKAVVNKSSRNAVDATYGSGQGRIQAVTFSGDLRLQVQ